MALDLDFLVGKKPKPKSKSKSKSSSSSSSSTKTLPTWSTTYDTTHALVPVSRPHSHSHTHPHPPLPPPSPPDPLAYPLPPQPTPLPLPLPVRIKPPAPAVKAATASTKAQPSSSKPTKTTKKIVVARHPTKTVHVKHSKSTRVISVSLSNKLSCAPESSDDHALAKRMFDEGWLHQDKSATFKAVYLLNARYVEDLRRKKADPSLPPLPRADLDRARYLFHGTQRACGIGSSTSTPCHNEECRVCCILRESFKMSCKSQRMFGPGIYSTTSSSKADVYAYNHHLRSHSHVILLCKVVCNRPQALFEAEHGRTQPDPGYNAVQAVTKDQGGAVEYNEYVVYREDAIVPVGIVVYARKGWKP